MSEKLGNAGALPLEMGGMEDPSISGVILPNVVILL